MKIEDIPEGTHLALDANILVYHASGASVWCRELLLLIEQGRVRASMPASTLAEATHRLMIAEARALGLAQGGNPARWLREHREQVRGLTRYQAASEAYLAAGVGVLPITAETLLLAARVRGDEGLLVNDSLLVASMRLHGLSVLASADRDFQQVGGLTVWSPEDVYLR